MPWKLVDRLPNWRVRWALTGRGALCLWPERLIVVDPGLTAAAERSRLAHEAIHAHRGRVPRWAKPREEEAVSRMAARFLIPFPALLDAVRWSRDPHEVADELHVDVPTLEARMRGLHPSERAALNRVLEEHHVIHG